jgi:hypothetical protein
LFRRWNVFLVGSFQVTRTTVPLHAKSCKHS